VRELGPVLTGLMIAGRISSALSAEISTMKVSDQIEALKTLQICPQRLLVVPKIVASLISMPVLITVSNLIAFLGSWVVAVFQLDYNGTLYAYAMFQNIDMFDVFVGLWKAVVFGFLITYIGTYCGINSDGSSSGVGKATTVAVVMASILILLFNYIITFLFF
jgi:phospholipid/cholesterol/gamma-HCH transport system permease protein